MSTYWGYHCRTCNDSTENAYNHGDDLLANLHASRYLIQKVKEIDKWLEVRILADHYGILDFLMEHKDHDMAIKNEYGQVINLVHTEHSSNTHQINVSSFPQPGVPSDSSSP